MDSHSTFTDDGWNRLEKEGQVFGVDGLLTILYNRDAELITSVGFDWKPDDMDRHESHMVNSIEKYFGD